MQVVGEYQGRRNVETFAKDVNFFNSGRFFFHAGVLTPSFITTGGDCGHVFVWHKETKELVFKALADTNVVNCAVPHPSLPIMVTSGIDSDVKWWSLTDEIACPSIDELPERQRVGLRPPRHGEHIATIGLITFFLFRGQLSSLQGRAAERCSDRQSYGAREIRTSKPRCGQDRKHLFNAPSYSLLIKFSWQIMC